MAVASLLLPLNDLEPLRRRVQALAENRPAVYRMVDPAGRVVYVGKAKRLRSRLLSYFRSRFPDDKAARILQATADIQWDYVPSEFAALLGELRQIRRYRPAYNIRMNRLRRLAFVKVAGGPAPKVYVGGSPGGADVRHYGPFQGARRLREAVQALNDLLGLRDCALDLPMVFSDQIDFFRPAPRAACWRHELGTCTGPCAGFVTAAEYARRVATALAFLEGVSAIPLQTVIREMTAASEADEFERAVRWRDRFDHLTWLLGAAVRVQGTLEALSFVYLDPGAFGDDRVYVLRRARVRASAPAPRTPIEAEAFRALVAECLSEPADAGPIPAEEIDEVVLVTSWFRARPRALRRAVPFDRWLATAS